MTNALSGNDRKGQWFENWFDSKYYHILYGNRDQAEADRFMNNLIGFLAIPPHSRIHDLCCGKGRHSVFLNARGFEVTGTDLSAESIQYASQFENESLSFFRSDMRTEIRINYFDFVFNLFTSFGYFVSDKEHEQVIRAVYKSLKPNGVFVLDYLNASKIQKQLVGEETKKACGIPFHIRKRSEKGCFVKEIDFKDEGKDFHFQEKIRAFGKQELLDMFSRNGFEILALKGDYALSDFDEENSDRLIVIGRKFL
jgi:SAM-dependent methyltransferase